MKTKKWLITLSLLILFLFVIFLRLIFSSDTNNIYIVKNENLVSTVILNGTYTTASLTKVNSPTNGIITELFVDNNNVVQKGDKLFHIESTANESQKRIAYSSYLEAKSQLDADNAALYSLQSAMYSKWKTFTDLATNSTYENDNKTPKVSNRVLTEFTTTQNNWLASEADVKNQQGVLAKDKAALSAAKLAYDETQSVSVTAPIAGTVINLAAEVNNQVSANSPVLIVADFSSPMLISVVDQVNIPKLQVGQKASVVFDALPDQTFNGTVRYIDMAGTKTGGTTNFNVYLTAYKLPPEIRLNMTASITIETGRKKNVLTVPLDAIIQKNGQTFVQLANKQEKEISIGLKGLTKVEIKSGLAVGEKIYVQ